MEDNKHRKLRLTLVSLQKDTSEFDNKISLLGYTEKILKNYKCDYKYI